MNKAAFYDLDGTLLSCDLVTEHAYYARNDRSLARSAYQFSKALMRVPWLAGMALYSRRRFNVSLFRAYRGMHRDRLVGLADDLFEVTLKPSIYLQAKSLIECTRDLGYRNVLVTGTLDYRPSHRAALRHRRRHLQSARIQESHCHRKFTAAAAGRR
jgi:phosphoserine phosphatase